MHTKDKNKINNFKKIKKIFGISFQVLLTSIIIFFIILLIRLIAFNKNDIFGFRGYIIISGSMSPQINPKDLVITRNTDKLQKGDIIAFQNKNYTIVHRIINIETNDNGKLYQTKGDNNNVEDPELVEQNQIRGKYLFKIPKIGNILIFLRNNIVLVIIMLCVLIIIILARRLL